MSGTETAVGSATSEAIAAPTTPWQTTWTRRAPVVAGCCAVDGGLAAIYGHSAADYGYGAAVYGSNADMETAVLALKKPSLRSIWRVGAGVHVRAVSQRARDPAVHL
eukprot:2087277-Rhodomonas_salina.6